jgi:hypothetical protein
MHVYLPKNVFTSDVNPLDPAGMAAQLVSEVQLALLIHCVHQDLNMTQGKVKSKLPN